MGITLSPKYVTSICTLMFLTNFSNDPMWVIPIKLSECVKIQ